MSTAASPAAPARSACRALDARTLGRPVHLLPGFALQLQDRFNALLDAQFNRRLRAGLAVSELRLEPTHAPLPRGAWLLNGDNTLACLLPRPVVLGVMALRFGTEARPTAAASTPTGSLSNDTALPPETATEWRCRQMLSRLLLDCLHESLQGTRAGSAPQADTALPPTLSGQSQPPFAPGCWLLQLRLSEARLGLDSELTLALDAPRMDALLRRLAPPRPASSATACPGTDLPQRLQLRLQARLLERAMLLGEVLDLRPGQVLPVRIQHTDVLVDGARLFTASVAEHQGKLCLTAFEDLP